MWRGSTKTAAGLLLAGAAVVAAMGGCASGELSQRFRENDRLRRENRRLSRELSETAGALADARRQIKTLLDFEADRPADLFAPRRIELARLTGGRDSDGKPGDDGVTVYLRPVDAEGDAVKTPGRITLQLLDNSDPASPRVLRVCEFGDADELQGRWHGKFLTQHYTLECPFPETFQPPDSGRLVVHATFVDYLTGRQLSATREVTVSPDVEPVGRAGKTP